MPYSAIPESGRSNLIPENVRAQIEELRPARHIDAITTKSLRLEHLCFQWHEGDQKAVTKIASEIGETLNYLYEFDTTWLRCMPFMEAEDRDKETIYKLLSLIHI